MFYTQNSMASGAPSQVLKSNLQLAKEWLPLCCMRALVPHTYRFVYLVHCEIEVLNINPPPVTASLHRKTCNELLQLVRGALDYCMSACYISSCWHMQKARRQQQLQARAASDNLSREGMERWAALHARAERAPRNVQACLRSAHDACTP